MKICKWSFQISKAMVRTWMPNKHRACKLKLKKEKTESTRSIASALNSHHLQSGAFCNKGNSKQTTSPIHKELPDLIAISQKRKSPIRNYTNPKKPKWLSESIQQRLSCQEKNLSNHLLTRNYVNSICGGIKI